MRPCWWLSQTRFPNTVLRSYVTICRIARIVPHGPPRPGDAARDREGLREQILKLREKHPDQVWLGGHSYGGRQASMLAAETPGLVDRLLLLSYPLHPPGKPEQLRTAHFPKLHDTGFVRARIEGSVRLRPSEMKSAMSLIPAPVQLLEIEGAGHDLGRNHAMRCAKDRLIFSRASSLEPDL